MKTMWELPTFIGDPGTLTPWGEVFSTGEHYSEPVSTVSSLSSSGIPISSVTGLGMQPAFHATACSHPALLMLASDGGLCPALASPTSLMHSLCVTGGVRASAPDVTAGARGCWVQGSA